MANPFTADDVKYHLVGLEGWLTKAAQVNPNYTDDAINTRLIPRIIRDFCREIKFRTDQIQCSAFPDGTYPATQNIPVKIEAAYTYYDIRAPEYLVTNLSEHPVQNVQRIRLMLNSGYVIYTIPQVWVVFDPKSGRVNLQPFQVNGMIAGSAAGFAILTSGFGYKGYIPQCVAVDYIAGLPTGWETLYEYGDLVLALEKACAIEILKQIAQLRDPGVNSKNIGADGLSQSLNYTRFMDRKQELETDIKMFKDTFAPQEVPFVMGFI